MAAFKSFAPAQGRKSARSAQEAEILCFEPARAQHGDGVFTAPGGIRV